MTKISIVIKPNSTKGPMVELQNDGSLLVYVRAVAAEGKANDALIKLLAEYYHVSKSNVTIVHGHISRYKIIEVT